MTTYFDKVVFRAIILNKGKYWLPDGTQVGIGCLGRDMNNELKRFDLHFHFQPSAKEELNFLFRNLSIGKFYAISGEATSFSDIPYDNLTVFPKDYKEMPRDELDEKTMLSILDEINEDEMYCLYDNGQNSMITMYSKKQIFNNYLHVE